MTYSLALHNGDLSLGGSRLDTVTGKAKLLQDLDTWFRESFQVDRFHPGYGSTLPSYIGGMADDMTVFLIRAEAVRVLNNYQQRQLEEISKNPQLFSDGEIVREITSVSARQTIDSVVLEISLKTLNGQLVNLERNVGT